MKKLGLLFLFINFSVYSIEPEFDLTQIDYLEISENFNQLQKSKDLPIYSLNEIIPDFVQRSIDANNQAFCGGVIEEEAPVILYDLHLSTTAYSWIPIDNKVIKTQHWITSP